MGRNTYEKGLTFEEWPYGKKPVIVLTHGRVEIPAHLKYVEQLADSPAGIVSTISKRGMKRLYVDGGKTIQGFLEAGLVNEITITWVPVLIGKGISLFGPLTHDIALRHIKTVPFPDGLVQSKYEIIR